LGSGLRIVEASAGLPVDDDEPVATSSAPTMLELIAEELGVDPDAFRDRLRDEIQRRRRALHTAGT
jgi:hypothetical protein